MSENWTKRRFGRSLRTGSFGSAGGEGDFQRDRARIIHCAAFRRLQGKTQVLGIGENDFYRTRLTHSLETAQISSGITESLRLRYQSNQSILDVLPPAPLIEAVGFAHDIGHAPFGHGGETAINFFMHDHGGFEANGQTLRIVTKLGEYSPNAGLDLTRRTILGLLKYPACHHAVCQYGLLPTDRHPLNLEPWRPPKCIMDDEKDILDWLLETLCADDRKQFTEPLPNDKQGHRHMMHRSLDATIMEYGDDIAYGVHDLEDALTLHLIDFQQWEREVIHPLRELGDKELGKQSDFYNKKLFSNSPHERKHAISRLVGYLIENIEIDREPTFDEPLLSFRAVMRSPAKEALEALKRFVFKWVIRSPEVQALEYRGQQMLIRLFETLVANPKRLLPREVYAEYAKSGTSLRPICDYVSSMTDTHATKLYLKLFSPDGGSVFERL